MHEIKELKNNNAEVGALCVAVVRQSFNQTSREIWGTTRGGSVLASKNKSMLGGPTGVSSVSAAAGALRALLRRHVQAYAPVGSEGVHKFSEACLVLYCNLAGGIIMATPLDGPAFRLRQQPPIVEDEEALGRDARETQLVHTCAK